MVFFVVWFALAIGGAVFFRGSRNAKLKRRVFPWFVATGYVLVLLYVGYYARTWQMLLLVLLIVSVIAVLNIRQTGFCDACGATSIHWARLSRAGVCSSCGGPLEAALERDGPV